MQLLIQDTAEGALRAVGIARLSKQLVQARWESKCGRV